MTGPSQESQPPTASAISLPLGATNLPLPATLPSLIQSQGQQPPTPQYPPGVKVPVREMSLPTHAFPSAVQPPSASQPLAPPPQQVARPASANVFPGSLSDLVVSFENVKQKGMSSFCSDMTPRSLTSFTLQQPTGCRIWTRCTSYLKEVIPACLSPRTLRSKLRQYPRLSWY